MASNRFASSVSSAPTALCSRDAKTRMLFRILSGGRPRTRQLRAPRLSDKYQDSAVIKRAASNSMSGTVPFGIRCCSARARTDSSSKTVFLGSSGGGGMLLALSAKLYDIASFSLESCRDCPTNVLDSLSYRVLGQVRIALGGL